MEALLFEEIVPVLEGRCEDPGGFARTILDRFRNPFLEHRLSVPFQSASMRFDRRAHVLVEIICDNGLTGWGECLGPARPNAAAVAAYRNWLIGMNPLETEKIWAVLYNALRDQGQRGLTPLVRRPAAGQAVRSG